MFTLLKKKSIEQKLQEKYNRLIEEGDKLLFTNQPESVKKYKEARRTLNQIESLKNAI
ncbi:Lacal_2735 family protein [Tenacibaculum sp. SZ-18]|uniref:Lacal_2735 family protein n=1 Tax=Tenacibaculum sp. SZ-18 TaxID=754423 RepID=UPI0012FE0274|nr:Lacal_2735 family protein [Tenacibaculum sp. SZ-18]